MHTVYASTCDCVYSCTTVAVSHTYRRRESRCHCAADSWIVQICTCAVWCGAENQLGEKLESVTTVAVATITAPLTAPMPALHLPVVTERLTMVHKLRRNGS
eukprot:COSAG01_NODE_1365_length_10560_cov_38.008986_10_plen_102_part_00